MPATAAQQLRDRYKPFKRTIEGVEVWIKRPDVRWLVYTRTLPVPLLEKVGTLLQEWIGQDLSKVADEAGTGGKDALELINFLTSVCLVSPKVVMTEEEMKALSEKEQENTILASELSVDFKEAAVIAALINAVDVKEVQQEQEAASKFSGDGCGEGTVQDVPSVRTETVIGVGDKG